MGNMSRKTNIVFQKKDMQKAVSQIVVLPINQLFPNYNMRVFYIYIAIMFFKISSFLIHHLPIYMYILY